MDLNFNANRDWRLFAHELHTQQTTGESLLWYGALKSKKMGGYQFRRRYLVNDSKVDFICLKLNLIIEIISNKPESLSLETKRDEDLRRLGYMVLHFTESEVINQFGNVTEQIWDAIELLNGQREIIN